MIAVLENERELFTPSKGKLMINLKTSNPSQAKNYTENFVFKNSEGRKWNTGNTYRDLFY